MVADALRFEPVHGCLPPGIGILQVEASIEGYQLVDKLIQDWNDGAGRFEREGEVLLVALLGDQIAGVGGVTIDPVNPDALRMRRFYIRKGFRRHGLGRRLAHELIARVGSSNKRIFVNAGTDLAPAFWEAFGFVTHRESGHTHALPEATHTHKECH